MEPVIIPVSRADYDAMRADRRRVAPHAPELPDGGCEGIAWNPQNCPCANGTGLYLRKGSTEEPWRWQENDEKDGDYGPAAEGTTAIACAVDENEVDTPVRLVVVDDAPDAGGVS